MIREGKKYKKSKESVFASSQSIGSWKEGLELMTKFTYAKFDESADLDVVLGIDPSKGEQTVRGSVLLPHGTGKKLKVLVFAKGDHEEAAKNAGADYVGSDDLIEKIQGGWVGFDVAVATPDLMGLVGKVAKILGPKGLLPNNKVGTVTFDVAGIVSELKKGRVSFRNDKGGIIHASFGRVSFGADKLLENLETLIKSIRSSKPASSKGKFVKKISVSSTMGPGVLLNADSVN